MEDEDLEKWVPLTDDEMQQLREEGDDEKVLAHFKKSRDPVVPPKEASSKDEALKNLDRLGLRGPHQQEACDWMLSIEFTQERGTAAPDEGGGASRAPPPAKKKAAPPRRGGASARASSSAASGLSSYATADVTGVHPSGSPVKGGIVGDPVGFGKTYIALAVVTANPMRPTLVVTLPATLDMWGRTASEFTGLSCCRMGSLAAEVPEGTDIVITTYSSIRSDKCVWARDTRWGRIILDEGHVIRNSATVTFQALMQLTADSRWVLTATPIHNGLKDLKSLYTWIGFDTAAMNERDLRTLNDRFLLARTVEAERKRNVHLDLPPLEVKDVLHDMKREELDEYTRLQEEFLAEVAQQVKAEAEAKAEAQAQAAQGREGEGEAAKKRQRTEAPREEAPAVRRMVTRSNGRNLAHVSSMRSFCVVGAKRAARPPPEPPARPPPEPLVTNGGVRNPADAGMLSAGLAAAGGGDGSSVAAASLAAREARRPATAAEAMERGLYDPLEEDRQRAQVEAMRASRPTSSKMDLTVRIVLDDLKEPDAKVVVFTTYLKEKDVLMETLTAELAEEGASCVCIHGSMPLGQRDANMAAFADDPSVRVIVAQMRCSSTGVNLQAANRVVITSPDYNPCIEKQAIGRVHRQGQTRPVLVRRLVTRNSIEEKCLAIQDRKNRIIEKNTAACTREGEADARRRLAVLSAQVALALGTDKEEELMNEMQRQIRIVKEGCYEAVDREGELEDLLP